MRFPAPKALRPISNSPRNTMRATHAVLLLALCGAALAALSLPQCCKSMSGNTYDACTCLSEDVTVNGESVTKDGEKHYHWIMTNWSSINVPDSVSRRCSFV